jgi:pimeloyl-ACP methyl ester carboxylesterase
MGSRSTRSAGHHRALTLLVMASLVPATAAAAPAGSDAGPACRNVRVPVAIAEGLPRAYAIRGRLCLPAGPVPATVQVLLHGATYSGVYWDFPYQPERYSYVRAMVAAGYATLDIDRLGFGASSHPPSVLVPMQVGAYAVHQVIHAARQGTIGTRFARIILVGHSMGTVLGWLEAAKYRDIDGFIATGNTHRVSVSTAIDISLHLYPAALDPRFAHAGLDPGYLTTQPGSRGVFYQPGDADPKVLAVDESTKDTSPLTEFFPTYQLEVYVSGDASRIDVPVLTAVGRYDRLMCSPDATTCSSASTLLAAEAPFYSPAACLQAYVLPRAGHDMNLHLNSQDFFAVAARWSDRWVGSSRTPSTHRPCAGPAGPAT